MGRSFTLRKHKIEFLNGVTKDTFYAAKNVNSIVKMIHYFLENSVYKRELEIPSNKHLAGLFGVRERQIQYDLQTLEDIDFIELFYEIERPKDDEGNIIKSVEKGGLKYLGKRLGIKVNQKEILDYLGYTKYDKEYKEAPKRGWFRRLVNQLPIEILGLLNHALACAEEANDQLKVEKILKRKGHIQRFVKKQAKRHKSYYDHTGETTVIDYLDVANTLARFGQSLKMRLQKPPNMVQN